MDKETGGAAFPRAAAQLNVGYVGEQKGMTLRDYFAAKELSKVDAVQVCDEPYVYKRLADHCYRMADAMLEARK